MYDAGKPFVMDVKAVSDQVGEHQACMPRVGQRPHLQP